MEITHVYSEKGYVVVSWKDNQPDDKYPCVYLRDCCHCSQCYNTDTVQRLLLLEDLDVEVEAVKLEVDNEGKGVIIEWSDGHHSNFKSGWLRESSLKPDEIRKKQLSYYTGEKVTWNNDFQSSIPTFNFEEVMMDDHTMLEWLLNLDKFGLTILANVPCNDQQLPMLAAKMAYLRRNPYGETFTLITQPYQTANLSYSPGRLGLHTDQPSLERPPNIQFLQCLKQAKTTGGENQLSDGFYAAKIIRETNPKAFQLLSSVPVDNYVTGTQRTVGKFHSAYRHPIISLDLHCNIKAVNFSNTMRFMHMCTVPLETHKPLYGAMKLFNDLIYQNMVEFKMREGDMIAFDNNRVLHGRVAYEINEGDERHLEGGYMEWDDIRSYMRVLNEKLHG